MGKIVKVFKDDYNKRRFWIQFKNQNGDKETTWVESEEPFSKIKKVSKSNWILYAGERPIYLFQGDDTETCVLTKL